MFEQPSFTLEMVESGLNYGRYKAEPLEQGYGTTLGNALRRILLRSLEGVAVSRVRIDNVWHEFSTIEHVREDVTEIVLNLKRIRLKRVMEMNGEARAHLYVRGDGSDGRVVTAADVQWPTEVDLVTPDQVIATLDSPDAVLDMDIWVSRDRGYRPAEAQRTETYSLGEIPIDAIYTPIQKVNFVVERTRVGPMSDYDRLIFEILTDGTIEPDDALAEAAQILVDHGRVFAEFNRRGREAAAPVGSFISDEVQNKPLADLGLSPRVLNALRSRQIERVGQILTMDPDQLLSIRNFGPRSMTELRQKLAEFGYLPEGEEIALGADLLLPVGDGVEGDLDDFGGFDNGDDVAAAIASLGGDGGAPDELGLNVRDEQE
ncbi:MAG: DNA-directed RNA polymerase alpha subunit [uncultured Thermomicrobiales bacterium]|uniref:DNA-directed RNA polymerase subunit alpha n=1 Tax=uncultured Thermomicrobiales bacterium TaxID=1645740 RepID=A0A6J4VI85_9BACT|nr:MAG: DNA-directed RNA polymerase alpha subunit [uncultured Thermomicrobiales bacterium]